MQLKNVVRISVVLLAVVVVELSRGPNISVFNKKTASHIATQSFEQLYGTYTTNSIVFPKIFTFGQQTLIFFFYLPLLLRSIRTKLR